MSKLSHLDNRGAARMVDVSDKPATVREAEAEALITLSVPAYEAALGKGGKKGDVFATARLAGIMAAKKTSELIPLCHSIPLSQVAIEITTIAPRRAFRILASARTKAQTGVEMEALTAAAVAALTIYDMVKAVDRGATIQSIRLVAKSGGKSGTYPVPRRKPMSRA